MTGAEVQLILMLLKVACPHLQRMAKETKNPIDDMIVGLVCSVASIDVPLDILEKGGD